MSSKLLGIKLERFQTKRPLARKIFLCMPVNQKMLCVANDGDDIRTGLLRRLPEAGVSELYAQTVDGERHDPDTYPIYLESEAAAPAVKRENEIVALSRADFLQEEVQRVAREQAAEAEPATPLASEPAALEERVARAQAEMMLEAVVLGADHEEPEPENVVRGNEAWREAVDQFVKDLPEDERLRFARERTRELAFQVGAPAKPELSFVEEFAAGATEAPEDRFFPGDAVRAMREAGSSEHAWIEQDPVIRRRIREERWSESDKARYAHALREQLREDARIEAASLEPGEAAGWEDLRALGQCLVSVVRLFAIEGDHYHSHDLKAIAGNLSECARIFFNASSDDRLRQVAEHVLAELQNVRRDLRLLALRDGYAGHERLHKALAEAVRLFRGRTR